MKSVKMFSEYLKEGIVTKRMPDMTRAKSLMKESEKSYNFLKIVVEKVQVDDSNSNNIIKNAYDVVMELIRARMIAGGFSSSGKAANGRHPDKNIGMHSHFGASIKRILPGSRNTDTDSCGYCIIMAYPE